MITVRYPNGQEIKYPSSTYLVREESSWNLYTSKGGEWVASIQASAGVIVESVPGNVRNPLGGDFSDLAALRAVRAIVEEKRLPYGAGQLLADIKRGIDAFNARYHTWKRQ